MCVSDVNVVTVGSVSDVNVVAVGCVRVTMMW